MNTVEPLTATPIDWLQSNTVQVTNILGLIGLVVLFILITTQYTMNRPIRPALNEPEAAQRIETVIQLLRMHFGTSWPYLMLGFAMVLLVIALLVFSRTQGVDRPINIEPTTAGQLLLVNIGIFVLLAVVVIGLFTKAFLSVPDYLVPMTEVDTITQQQQRQNVLYGLAIGMVVIFALSFLTGFVKSKMT